MVPGADMEDWGGKTSAGLKESPPTHPSHAPFPHNLWPLLCTSVKNDPKRENQGERVIWTALETGCMCLISSLLYRNPQDLLTQAAMELPSPPWEKFKSRAALLSNFITHWTETNSRLRIPPWRPGGFSLHGRYETRIQLMLVYRWYSVNICWVSKWLWLSLIERLLCVRWYDKHLRLPHE